MTSGYIVGATRERVGNAEAVRELFEEMVGRHRFDEIAGRIFPGYVEHDPLISSLPGGLVDFWRTVAAEFEDLEVRVENLVPDNDRVMLFVTWRGRTRSGVAGALHTAELFRLEDGLVAEHWDVVDRSALVPLGIGPGEGAQPAGPGLVGPHSDLEVANAELVLGAYREVFTEHRLDIADEYYHRNYTHHNLKTDTVPSGLDACKAFVADNIAMFPDLTATVEHIVADGDRVMVFVLWRGTLTGRWSGGEPSGRELVMRTCDHFRIAGRKVAELCEVVDYLPLQQAGLPTP
ncbi:ester cyclase family protein [Streptomyces sp. H39-S7]|uniref:ester cyclase family protein n=1 Tax=Streptomyces sp. H39-S7 TaxID=3004357 RepID=UPI0022AF9ECA|nr:ester cyclase family protein [Streptomyces sp. H39-S7]MCZ4119522.1 ester cyclase family protein [Streptomyces sp. H39-S7]